MEEIRKEYKLTEVGIIPEDWEITTIDEHLQLLTDYDANGSFADMANNVNTFLGHGFAWYVRATDLEQNTTMSEVRYSDQNSYKFLKKSSLHGGELLIAKRGEIGKVYYFIMKTKYATLAPNLYLLKLQSNIESKYLYYFLKSDLGQAKLKAINASTSLGAIYKDDVKKLEILYPPIDEQRAIATALSDIDFLISSLNKKIEKKKAIKQSLMQQLLTGKKRLPGFSGEWVEKKLGEIGSLIKLSILPNTTPNKMYCEYSMPSYDNGKHPQNVYGSEMLSARFLINGNLLLFNKLNVHQKRIWNVIVNKSNSVCSTEFLPYQSKNIDLLLLEYILNTDNVTEYFISVSKGTSNSQKRINPDDFLNFVIKVPSTKEEQTAIATILSDIDKDISETEASRDKYIQIKAAMMQQLLTGKIRLVGPVQENLCTKATTVIPIDAHIIGGHIVRRLYASNGWGRTKFQKALHLTGYCCQLDLGNGYIRNTAGPDDEKLMNYIDSKFKQYHQVEIEKETYKNGHTHYNYIPTKQIAEIEQAFDSYPVNLRNKINSLLDKIGSMDLGRAEIVSTLYAVWNNRIIKKQEINDHVILSDFYAWSKHKSDFSKDLVLKALNYMRNHDIVPIGWGKYIDKK